MPILRAEVIGRLDQPKSCQSLLYAPLAQELCFRHTRLYEFQFSGDQTALIAFVRKVLLDEVCQDLHLGEEPGLSGQIFLLDYGMKPSALDLEKESILAFQRETASDEFRLEGLRIFQRLYIFGADAPSGVAERFTRDICNPAIHTWRITDVRAHA